MKRDSVFGSSCCVPSLIAQHVNECVFCDAHYESLLWLLVQLNGPKNKENKKAKSEWFTNIVIILILILWGTSPFNTHLANSCLTFTEERWFTLHHLHFDTLCKTVCLSKALFSFKKRTQKMHFNCSVRFQNWL